MSVDFARNSIFCSLSALEKNSNDITWRIGHFLCLCGLKDKLFKGTLKFRTYWTGKLKAERSGKVVDERCKTFLQPTARSAPDLRKRTRKLNVSPEEKLLRSRFEIKFKGVHLCEGGISNAFSGMFVRRTNSKMRISLTLFWRFVVLL